MQVFASSKYMHKYSQSNRSGNYTRHSGFKRSSSERHKNRFGHRTFFMQREKEENMQEFPKEDVIKEQNSIDRIVDTKQSKPVYSSYDLIIYNSL